MIIKSFLDTDAYKYFMLQAIFHQYSSAQVEYKFVCRTPGIDFFPIVDDIRREVYNLSFLRFQDDELKYLSSLRFLTDDFIEFLKGYRLNTDFVKIDIDDNYNLDLRIKGPWWATILFEVPILAIISEIYCCQSFNMEIAAENLLKKAEVIDGTGVRFADFGTRRRALRAWQYIAVELLQGQCRNNFVGTSNLWCAKELGLKAIGTMAHEWLQAHQALGGQLRDSQKEALQVWAAEYRGDLGIALTDVIGVDAFIRDFDLYFAKLYDGVRHDSGSPDEFAEKIITHYKNIGIDPLTKSIVFSDGLNFEEMIRLEKKFFERINVSFGIGTNLTNDGNVKPLQIVLKMVVCNGKPVAKISDSLGKGMCEDEQYVQYLKKVFSVRK